jgi:hypothetical protein
VNKINEFYNSFCFFRSLNSSAKCRSYAPAVGLQAVGADTGENGCCCLSEARREIANEKKYEFGTVFCERHISFKMTGGEEITQGRKER